jgi:Holliday junction DNA helicase RuvA
MIATLEGQVTHKDTDYMIIAVGGVGIEVFAPRTTIDKITGERAFLYTRLIVREDSLTLYGFSSQTERDLFDTFIKISGVGPKLAITMLSSLSTDNIRNAVVSERPEILTRVPGIGKKTAQKILFELKDKISVGLDAMPAGDFENINADVMDALTALGYSVIEAQSAVQSIPADAPEEVDQRILIALQSLGS